MILIDTSVRVDHFRTGHRGLEKRLDRNEVLGRPWVIGELALGHLSARAEILRLLRSLPQAEIATTEEVAAFIERHQLPGTGIGYGDAQLLAATRLTPDATFWTNDKRLAAAASRLRLVSGST